MADYGASDTSTTALGANQFPISEVYVPNSTLTALEGGPASTDGAGKKSSPASMYVKDGSDVAQGAQADAAYTSGSGSIVSILKGIFGKVAGTLTISGAVTTSGTVTEANSAASKTDLDTIVTNTNKIPASPATEGGHLATIDSHIPALGQALAAASVPVVLTSAQQTALTPPAAITGFALEAGHIATIDTSTASSKTDLDNISTVSGATTDVAVVGDNTGTISAKLRGLTKILNDIWDGVNHRIKVDGSGVTQPVSGTFWQATQPVSGTVTANQGGTWTVQPGNTANTTPWLTSSQAATTGGSTPSHTISAASTNATSLKGSAGTIYGFSISNTNAAARYFKLFNKASAPTLGTDTPVMTVQVPASGTVMRAYPVGLALGTGIAWAATGALADLDATAIGAGDLSIDLDYK